MTAKPALAKVPVIVIKQGKMVYANCSHYDLSAVGFTKDTAIRELQYRISTKTGQRPVFDITERKT